MRGRCLHKVLMAMVAAALCSAPLRGVTQEVPTEVESDPWVEIHVTPTETVLLPGEPPRILVEVGARPYPGAETAYTRSERFWITPEGGERQELFLMHRGTDFAEACPSAISRVRDYLPQSIDLYLYPPRQSREVSLPIDPPFAFPAPGRYTFRVGIQTAYVRREPPPRLQVGAGGGEDVHVTPMLLANPVEFTILEPPPAEQEPSRFVLSNGWFSGCAPGGPGHLYWGWNLLEEWPPEEDLRAFIDRFPGSRYADYARLQMAFMRIRPLCTGTILCRDRPPPPDALEEAARLLEAIRCDGFSRADEALEWLAIIYFRLGRQTDARAAWDRLMSLSYPSPCKVSWDEVGRGRACGRLGR